MKTKVYNTLPSREEITNSVFIVVGQKEQQIVFSIYHRANSFKGVSWKADVSCLTDAKFFALHFAKKLRCEADIYQAEL